MKADDDTVERLEMEVRISKTHARALMLTLDINDGALE
jgi:hypothetical protein